MSEVPSSSTNPFAQIDARFAQLQADDLAFKATIHNTINTLLAKIDALGGVRLPPHLQIHPPYPRLRLERIRNPPTRALLLVPPIRPISMEIERKASPSFIRARPT